MKRTTLAISIAAILVGVLPSSGFAAKCSGTNINHLVAWEPSEIAKGTTTALFRVASTTVNDNAAAASHLVSGECIGTSLATPDGKSMESGVCSRRDKDGDVLNEEWRATDGAGSKGEWKNVGGTGKFANARDSGQWEFTPLQGKMSAVRWTGDCK